MLVRTPNIIKVLFGNAVDLTGSGDVVEILT